MARNLVFDVFAIDRASAVFRHVGDEAEHMGGKLGLLGKTIGAGVAAIGVAAASAVAFGGESIKMAAEFESSMMRLQTTAGESPKNMKMVGDGLLAMTSKVGYSANELATAMYKVESGGFHGAQGLKVLEVASKAAKIENADATDVATALTGALNDYKGTNITAAEAANVMTAAVGHGMMTFQDLAQALPHIGTRAAAAKVTFEELTGALATMTQDGLPAAVAATYLGQTIGQLAAPLPKARKEMEGLGIDATKLSMTITSGSGHGLVDAIKMLYTGIANHLTPSGLVAVDTFKKSKGAAADFQTMLLKLPPSMQTAYQTLAVMAGGVKGMQGVLLLGGSHLSQFAGNVKAMSDQVRKGGNDVAGYAEQQATLKGKLDDAKASWSALMVTLGNYFLPVAKQVLDWFNGSMPSIERWTNAIAEKAGPIIKQFGAYFTNELWPMLQRGYDTILPGIKQAWDILTGGIKSSGVQWKDVGHFVAAAILVLAELARVVLPVVAVALRVVIQLVTNMIETCVGLAHIIQSVGVIVLDEFSNMATSMGHMLISLSKVPLFGWAKDAGNALLGAAGSAKELADRLNGIHNPPAINIPVGVYGTSAVASALIAGNNPLANAMMSANKYAGGGAYSTVVSGSQRTNGGLRAVGGPVEAGMRYRVGENGPEDVTFGANGYVHDAKTTKAGGGNGPAVWIDKYYANDKPITQISSDLMFRMQHA
jgi:TP901 family phage tail tape measure protein